MLRHPSLRSLLAALSVLLLTAWPTLAATPPLTPFDQTADLFVADNGCDCLLRVAPDGTVTVEASEAEIVAADPDAADATAVDMNESGVAMDADGTLYFVNSGSNSLLRKTRTGSLEVVISATDLAADPGSTDLEKIAFASDGTLYASEEDLDGAVAIDVAAGTASVLVAQAALEALPGITSADVEAGIGVDSAGNVYIASDGTPDAVFKVAPDGTPSVLATAPSETQHVSTDATGGTFTLSFGGEGPTGSIAYDASAADVQTALEGLSNLDPGDVAVSGAGTATDPWVVEFHGAYEGADVAQMTGDGSGLSGGTLTISTADQGGTFDDLDVHATRGPGDVLIIADDAGGDWIYEITTDGEIRTFLSRSELDAVAEGSGVDLEGGMTFDGQDRFYLAEEDSSDILRFDLSSGTGEIWVQDTALGAASGTTPELDGGIAFSMPIVDLAVTHASAPAEVVPGEVISWTVRVTNNGPDSLTAFGLDATPPSAVTDVTFAPSAGTYDAGTGRWDATLAPSATADLVVSGTVDPSATGTITHSAALSMVDGVIDTDGTNDTSSADTALTPEADLSIVKDAPSTIAAAGSATVDLTVTNAGPSDAADVTIVDDLADGLTFVSAAGDGWTCSSSNGSVTCTHGTLTAGASSTVTLTLETSVDCTADATGVITCTAGGTTVDVLGDTATVSSSTTDPDTSNNTDSGSSELTVENTPPVIAGGLLADVSVQTGEAPPALSATDADGDVVTWTVAEGELPTGLSLNPDGSFSGTAEAAGTSTVTVQACDDGTPSLCDTQTLTITVSPAPAAEEPLPATGVGDRYLALGLAFLVLGGTLLLAHPRRRGAIAGD